MSKLKNVEEGSILLVLKIDDANYEVLEVDEKIHSDFSKFMAKASNKYPLLKTGILLKEKTRKNK